MGGTGNDLARVLGWGGGFQGGSLVHLLQDAGRAQICLLDRWTVSFDESLAAAPAAAPRQSRRITWRRSTRKHEPRAPIELCNYLCVGVGAAVTLGFHQMRERRPDLFVLRFLNKVWYTWSGLQTLASGGINLATSLSLTCDGVELELPQGLQGVVVLNINSYGGGCDLWGTDGYGSDEALVPLQHSPQDKLLDVVGVRSIVEITAAQVGLPKLANTVRLAQANSVTMVTTASLPVQIDGEPFKLERATTVDISWKSQALMLEKVPGDDISATEIVEWALQRGIVNAAQRSALLAEIASRRGARAA
eukprot:NODE_1812_length_1058_cov_225.291127.p1 GENE.NODE_1812_length_1058_cov_225.291127~~NODE_1812_length_1058_cov_225.291127.p1  ORF type:complete len:306 (-),score=107.85 NODE_1812_length_1058_cov_225.291127:123-1040(-)